MKLKSLLGLAMATSLAGCGTAYDPPFAPAKAEATAAPVKKAEPAPGRSIPEAEVVGRTIIGNKMLTVISEFRPASMPDKICISAQGSNSNSGVSLQCFDAPKAPKGP